MEQKEITDWIKKPLIQKIILAFNSPTTPGQVEKITREVSDKGDDALH